MTSLDKHLDSLNQWSPQDFKQLTVVLRWLLALRYLAEQGKVMSEQQSHDVGRIFDQHYNKTIYGYLCESKAPEEVIRGTRLVLLALQGIADLGECCPGADFAHQTEKWLRNSRDTLPESRVSRIEGLAESKKLALG